MRGKGRRFVLGLTALAAATLVGAGLALKDAAREEWWIWRLGSRDHATRKRAAEQLGEIGSARAILPLLELYRDAGGEDFLHARDPVSWQKRADLPRYATQAIRKILPKAPREVLRGLEHQSAPVRWISARIFSDNQVPPEGLPILAKLLEDPVYLVRVSAAIALLNAGEAGRPFFSRPIQSDPELQQGILDHLKVYSPPLLRVLLAFLEIDGLGLADRALPMILKACKESGIETGAPKDPSLLIQVVQKAFQKGSVDTRIELARAIGGMGPIAMDLVADLIEASTDEDRRLRIQAIIALGEIGSAARDAIPFLSDALKEGDEGIRRLAEGSLNLIRVEPR